jgi:predicted Zn finger-like uncharacterized protein
MKVGCQQCGASYSVADDKVEGRKLKLRCKRCGEPMIIDGRPDAQQDDGQFGAGIQVVRPRPSTLPEGDAEPSWYLALDESAQGPYRLVEVIAHCASGLVSADTLVFHDGLDGWKKASDVPELSTAFGGERERRVPPPPAAKILPLDRNVTMGSDPFAEPSAAPPSLSPRVAAADMLTSGAQRDGTVQFSLDEIRALSAMTSPSLMPPPPAKTGYASGEDSGLIDVRSLSEAATDDGAFRPIEQLAASPLDTMAPLTLPVAQRSAGVDFRTKVMAGLAAFGVVLAGGVGVLAVTRSPDAQVATAAAAAAEPEAAAPVVNTAMAAALPEAAAAPAPQNVAGDSATVKGDAEHDAREDRSDHAGRGRRLSARAARGDKGTPPQRAEKSPRGKAGGDLLTQAPAEKTAEKKASKGGDDIDALLLGALNAKKAPEKRETAPAPDSSLPSTPGRAEMLAALGKAKAKASQCKGPGVATAAITIAGSSGRATDVSVSGVEGAAKSCVEKAVRATSFPKFKKDTFAVNFPFQLK